MERGLAEAFPRHALTQVKRHAGADNFKCASLRAVYFGGGTASLMPQSGLCSLLIALRNLAPHGPAPEVTLECEPGTIHLAKLRAAREHGVNRVSVGAQSMSDKILRTIGRRHTADDSLNLVDACLTAGIRNIHVDLMYGLPEQSQLDWESTVAKVTTLPITHVSTYKLFVFLYGALHRANQVPRARSESNSYTNKLRAMHDVAREILETAGFWQYSLTEYARKDYESAYILSCFDGTDILPIGPGAFGRCGSEVFENSSYVSAYGSAAETERARAFKMSPLDSLKRDVILGLWLLDVDVGSLARRYGSTPSAQLRALLQTLATDGLIQYSNDRIVVAEHQRFGIGTAMDRLAQLAADQWGESDDSACTRKVNVVIRTARREPQFFRDLKNDPKGTLRRSNIELTESELTALTQIIQSGDAKTFSPALVAQRELWRNVEAEHTQRVGRNSVSHPPAG